jgi:hypothetical protein
MARFDVLSHLPTQFAILKIEGEADSFRPRPLFFHNRFVTMPTGLVFGFWGLILGFVFKLLNYKLLNYSIFLTHIQIPQNLEARLDFAP